MTNNVHRNHDASLDGGYLQEANIRGLHHMCIFFSKENKQIWQDAYT